MPDDIKTQINKMYDDVVKSGKELLSRPSDINEKIYQNQREMMKKRENIIIEALGRVNPSLASEIERLLKRKLHEELRYLIQQARIEVQCRPNGEEVYSFNGNDFLKITREDKATDNEIKTIFKHELL